MAKGSGSFHPKREELLRRLDELITFKPQKSRSLSFRRGEWKDVAIFIIGRENIPNIVDQPIKRVGRQYTSSLLDKEMVKTILQQLSAKPLKDRIKSSTWEVQGVVVQLLFIILYQRIMWPMKLCEVTSLADSKIDAKTNSSICKWLGLPLSSSATGL